MHAARIRIKEMCTYACRAGKNIGSCHDLKVNGSTMEKSSKEKYLGEILTSDGKINDNITSRYNKGIGTANTIISLLKEVYILEDIL